MAFMIIIYSVLLLLTIASFYNFSDFFHRFSILYQVIFFILSGISSYLFLTVKNNPGVVKRSYEGDDSLDNLSSLRIENQDNYTTTKQLFDRLVYCEKCAIYIVKYSNIANKS